MMVITTINSISVNPRCPVRRFIIFPLWPTNYHVRYFVPSNPVPSDLV